MIVVVGGQARKVGKTRAVCEIIAATPEARWVVYKMSPHFHGRVEPGQGGDTGRFLRAGAAEAFLIESEEIPALPQGRNVIIESNTAAAQICADLFLFVVAPEQAEWKESARRLFGKADCVVSGSVPPQVIDWIHRFLSGWRLSDPPGSPHRRHE